jgi:stage V sporulation protein SpoVS
MTLFELKSGIAPDDVTGAAGVSAACRTSGEMQATKAAAANTALRRARFE